MSHAREILLSLNANARKSLSQNFLTSPHWAEKLVKATLEGPEPEEYWEIGPGLGALTRVLISKTQTPLRAFEFDRKLVVYLKETFPSLILEEGDFLDTEVSLFSGKTVAVLSNLPYHISSPILYKLNDFNLTFLRLVLTFQKEFAERLIAKPRTKAYGALSVLTQLQYRISSLGTIPKGAFFPIPEIDSEAVLMIPKLFEVTPFMTDLVKKSFLHRRKKLISNLTELFSKTMLEKAFRIGNISQNVRAEELSLEQYLFLCEQLSSSG